MSVRRRNDNGKWMTEFTYRHSDGRKEIVRKISPINTKRGAEQFEMLLRQKKMDEDQASQSQPIPKIFQEYAETFMNDYARVENKPSEVASKERILQNHLLPAFGGMRLDAITRDDIKTYRSIKLKANYNPKTINNHVAVLCRILSEAVESGFISFVPRVRRLKTPPQKFDFLIPEEAQRLVDAGKR